MDDIVQEFLTEAFEQVGQLDQQLDLLRAEPRDPDALVSAFRSLHTMKGAAGFLALSQLEALSAAGELLLGRAQKGQLVLTPARLDALAEVAVAVRSTLDSVRGEGVEGAADHAALLDRLGVLAVP